MYFKKLSIIPAFMMLVFITAAVFPQRADANLGITPTIISFADGDRYKDVTLINMANETKTFIISWRFFEMQETGSSYKPIEASLTEFDVSKYVFYTPRRVTIPAKGSQKVRLAFRRPSEVTSGDYHAHLVFSPADTPEVEGEKKQEQSASAGVSVRVGYSIPVLIRAGSFENKGQIGQVQMRRSSQGRLVADVPVIRQSPGHGVVAKLEAYHIPAGGGEEKKIGEVINANVFTEIQQRIVPVTMREEIKGGQLKILLKSSEDDDDTVYDQEIFPLN